MKMKRRGGIFTFIILFATIVFLQNCKREPGISSYNANDPDSLYIGRPYVAPVITHTLYTYRPINSPADNPMTYEGIQLGRMLFYDSTLSLAHQLSCGDCHQQQYAFGDNSKLSQNVLGPTVRNTPTLTNMGMNSAFFWDGRQATIEDAVNDAFNHEMRPDFTAVIRYLSSTPQYTYLFKKAFGRPGDITETKITKAIAQFIRTMVSVNSRIDQYYRGEITLTPSELAGLNATFDQNLGDCFHCHMDLPRYLSWASQDPKIMFGNNAIDSAKSVFDFVDKGRGAIDGDTNDYGKFKVPTLRNVAVSGPYMHDGRYTSLQEVIAHYNDSLLISPTVNAINLQHYPYGGLHLDPAGQANLIAFLNALTDTAFLHNPALSNPFH
jgi:cytochrome c peroxidase